MKVIVNHTLSRADALQCSKEILEHLRRQHATSITSVVEVWTDYKSDFSFRYRNMSITGNIFVNENNIEISGRLPMAAMLFNGIIEDTIKREAAAMLGNCKKSV